MNDETVKQPIVNLPDKKEIPIAITFLVFFAVPFTLGILVKYQALGIWISAIILLLLTWRFYARDKGTLAELGLNTHRRNLGFLALGILVGCIFFALLFIIQMSSNSIQVEINKDVSYFSIALGLFLLAPAVVVEELIFRGYCFKKFVVKAGIIKANIVFALLFLVWHWIAFNAWGNIGMMIGLLTTCFGHLLFSSALMKSGTLYFPIGIHLGNNWTSHHFFASSTGGINTQGSDESFFIVTKNNYELPQVNNVLAYTTTLAYMLIFIWIIWRWKFVSTRG